MTEVQGAAEREEARALYQAGRFASALPLLERLAEESPTDLQIRRALAASAFQVGDYSRAEHAYREVLALDPASAEAARFLALSLERQGKAPEPPPVTAPRRTHQQPVGYDNRLPGRAGARRGSVLQDPERLRRRLGVGLALGGLVSLIVAAAAIALLAWVLINILGSQ